MWNKMYNRQRRTNMICEQAVKRYCPKGWTGIENYDKAVADKTRTWHCHHRLETLWWFRTSQKDLQKFDLYYNRPASELVFLPSADHAHLHLDTTFDSRPISQYRLTGDYINTYNNKREASNQSGVPTSAIWAAINGRVKSGGGFIWKYATWDELRNLFGFKC